MNACIHSYFHEYVHGCDYLLLCHVLFNDYNAKIIMCIGGGGYFGGGSSITRLGMFI
jgi:hypothetical protein